MSKTINNTIFYGLLLLVVLSPLPFGSNTPWAWSLLALITSLLTLAWVANTIINNRKISLSLPPILIILFLIPVIWAFLQASTITPDTWAHPLWQMTAETLSTSVPATISIVPDNTYTAVMRLITYGLIFYLSFQFCRNKEKAETTLKWIATAGVIYATYGLIIQWGGFNTILWYERTAYTTDVTSTFINRNSYATYAGLGLISLITVFLKNSAKQTRKYNGHSLGKQKRIELFIINSWKPLLGLMLITTALITTHSRGGFISTAIAVVVLLAIYSVKKRTKSKTLLGTIAGLIIIILLAFTISSETLLKRMEYFSDSAEDRMQVYELTTTATKDAPMVGFGYGAFQEGFRLYRSEEIPGIYDKAHNTYVENSFELGVPAAMSLFLVIIGTLFISVRGVVQRCRDWLYPTIGVSATILVAIHSFVDFSLQIPAVATVFSVVLGAAVANAQNTT